MTIQSAQRSILALLLLVAFLTGIIVLQGRVISNQRHLIIQLYKDAFGPRGGNHG